MSRRSRAFTLIELLVVISVIGLLASMVLVNLRGSKDKANIAKVLDFSQTVFHAQGADAVGIWRFDDSKVTDVSGHDNNGVLVGGASFSTNTPYILVGPGQGKLSLSLDGVDDLAYINSNLPGFKALRVQNKNFTLSGWAYPKGGTNNAIFGLGYCWRWSYGFERASGVLRVQLTASSTGVTSTYSTGYTMKDNNWYFMAMTVNKDTGMMDVYINGKKAKTFNVAAALPFSVGGCWTHFGFGRHGAPSTIFNGLIDDVILYEGILSAAEIEQHYAEGLNAHQNIAMK